MFCLSISASVILPAQAGSESSQYAFAQTPNECDANDSVITLSIEPSAYQRWSVDLLGPDIPECASSIDVAGNDTPERFDIRVGWGNGTHAELLGVPLSLDASLVVGRSGAVRLVGADPEAVFEQWSQASD